MNQDKQNQIISAIAIECGLEPTTVRRAYTGLVRYILKKLRQDSVCPLPGFGTFRITRYSPRNTLNVNSGVVERLDSRKVVKFEADYKLKGYVREKL